MACCRASVLTAGDNIDANKPGHVLVRCAQEVRDHLFNATARVDLCRGSSGSAPAKCAQAVRPTVPAEDRVILCRGAPEQDPMGPAWCFNKASRRVPLGTGVALCQGVTGSGPVDCVEAARHSVLDNSALLHLCRHASSSVPAECAKAMIRVGADERLAVNLCAASSSIVPSICFAEAPKEVPPVLRAQACTAAESTAPALCLATSRPRSYRVSEDPETCPLDPGTKGPPRKGLEPSLAARLCRGAVDDGPAKCGRAAPSQMADEEVSILCEAVGMPIGEPTAHCATKALMFGIDTGGAASLCRGARSDAPAICAVMLPASMGVDTRLAVCAGAQSDVPARCINALPPTRPPTEHQVKDCRVATARPSALRITSLGYDGEELLPDQPVQASLEVRDQWGGRIPGNHGTFVRASIALRGSNGAFVNPHGRLNSTTNGIVQFSYLSFSAPGNLTLQFSIDSEGVTSVPQAVAYVVVTETKHEATVRRCARIFESLSCPVQGTPSGGQARASEATSRLVNPEAVAVLDGGAAAVLDVLACHHVLEENGVRVALLPGGPHLLRAWLWYQSGIELLEAGVGLPSREQSSWEKLGIQQNADVKEVRRAYYRQSLMWHPDRWVRHPRHVARAQEIFEVVTEAYYSLARGARKREG